jgi:ribose transport system substrate-binding protein
MEHESKNKNSFKKWFSTLLIFIVLTSFYSCGDEDSGNGGENGDEVTTITITMIAKSSSNPVFLAAKTGAEEKAQDLSEKYDKLEVVIDWKTPQNDNVLEQAEIIRNAVSEGTDAILISCSDRDTITEAINYAVDNGVPVMTFDSDAPDSKRFAFYGPDNVELGKQMMTKLAGLVGNSGKIAILGGNQSAENLQRRIEGIKKAADEFPNIEIVGTFYNLETEEASIDTLLKVQEMYPDIKGWVMVGGWPLFGEKLLKAIEPGKIKIVGLDALLVQLKYIEKNYVQVLFGQPTFRWGEVSVETIIDEIYLDKEVDEINIMKTIPVSIENLGGWSRQLRAWGYEDIPEKYLVM